MELLENCIGVLRLTLEFCLLRATVVLSQVQYRLGFDFLGRGIQKDGYSSNPEHLSNRAMMLIITASWLLINLGIYSGYNWKWSRGLDLTVADTSAVILVNVAMYGFVVFVTQSTRSSLREKFLIREQRCHDLEDIVLATTCLPCTVGQMSRHTANYDDYEAVCCSKTGLPDGVRVNQSRKEEGDYMV
jgi:Cys-rich protein (TIGR01571 family)